MKTKIDDAVMNRASELIGLLSDPGAYQKWLAEMRGIIAAADNKLAAADAAAAKAKNAEKLLADATASLLQVEQREQAIEAKEAGLRDREGWLAAKIKEADEAHTRRQSELATKERLLNGVDERIKSALASAKEVKEYLDREWAELDIARGRVKALH
jgi:chromosome segregation ATPase